jgi:hypothetical protein
VSAGVERDVAVSDGGGEPGEVVYRWAHEDAQKVLEWLRQSQAPEDIVGLQTLVTGHLRRALARRAAP